MAAGLEIEIRRVRPADAVALERFYAGLSAQSRRARFLGASAGLSASQSRGFCTPDHSHAEGFVAVSSGPADARPIVGHVCLEPVDERRVELAIAVADEWQRHGIGRRLFEAALGWAAQHRYAQIVATAYADNGPVLRLLSSAEQPVDIGAASGGVVEVRIPLVGPLPQPWQHLTAAATSTRRRRAWSRPEPAGPRRNLRVVWRRTQRPARDAAG
jgi:GNAT superfamily N-acetyltransferase